MSYLDVPRDDISVWWNRLDVDSRFHREGIDVICLFMQEYRYLSNFHELPILYNGKFYMTTEHAYQAAKTDDEFWKEEIRRAETPAKAKKLGMACPLRPSWDDEKFKVMKDVLCYKFSAPEMQEKLLKTGDSYLIEGNVWHDNNYGICFRKGCEKCQDKRGKNMLGNILMEIRQTIRKGRDC